MIYIQKEKSCLVWWAALEQTDTNFSRRQDCMNLYSINWWHLDSLHWCLNVIDAGILLKPRSARYDNRICSFGKLAGLARNTDPTFGFRDTAVRLSYLRFLQMEVWKWDTAVSMISPPVRVRVSVSIVYRIATGGYSWIWPIY